MQIGTRWPIGEQPPASVPDELVTRIHEVETELVNDDIDTDGWRWTLTFFEGRPVVELDDGTVIR